MSKIDLDKLVVRKTYFIPVESTKLEKAIINQLNATDPPIDGLFAWNLIHEYPLGFHFEYALKYSFVFDATWGMEEGTDEYRKLVKEKSKEFEKMGTKAFFNTLRKGRSNIPCNVYVFVMKKEGDGCLCKVECLPLLYDKLTCIKEFKADDIEIQSAHLETERFAELIFESGLSATLIAEEKEMASKEVTQFLINDQLSHQILDKIETMLDHATCEVLICGWVGTILLPKLNNVKKREINIRIITHKAIELKGEPGKQDVERAYGELISLIGKENLSIRPECHFRVLVVDNKALVGSMDLNAISLAGTHREFAIYTEVPEVVRSIRNYFNQIFTPLKE